MEQTSSWLSGLGVFGFDSSEHLILAALVTEDPLLLIGRSGTGKTFLLNSLSEALGLEHRHYNASLIAFDDLVGFPFPEQDKGSIQFLQTPATIWQAQSVLIDEISRCKPEHQNRLFSIVHERRVQGMALDKLRYRWAAMNPCSSDQDDEVYSGSEPLDPALADRFGLFVRAAEWSELRDDERAWVAHPQGEGLQTPGNSRLQEQVAAWRTEFVRRLADPAPTLLAYATTVATQLNSAGVRVSPRRVRMFTRSLVALEVVAGPCRDEHYRRALECSLPHATWGTTPDAKVIAAAHRAAWDMSRAVKGAWIHGFLAAKRLNEKLAVLLDQCKDTDEGSQAISLLLGQEETVRAHAFAFAVCPAALLGQLPIGAEGLNELSALATATYAVDGEISWFVQSQPMQHPQVTAFARVLNGLKGARKERALQFFNWCLVHKHPAQEPADLEDQIHRCILLLNRRAKAAKAVRHDF